MPTYNVHSYLRVCKNILQPYRKQVQLYSKTPLTLYQLIKNTDQFEVSHCALVSLHMHSMTSQEMASYYSSLTCFIFQPCSLCYSTSDPNNQIIQSHITQSVIFFWSETLQINEVLLYCSAYDRLHIILTQELRSSNQVNWRWIQGRIVAV